MRPRAPSPSMGGIWATHSGVAAGAGILRRTRNVTPLPRAFVTQNRFSSRPRVAQSKVTSSRRRIHSTLLSVPRMLSPSACTRVGKSDQARV